MHVKKLGARYFLLSFAMGFLTLSVAAMLVVLVFPPSKAEAGKPSKAAPTSQYLPREEDRKNMLISLTGSTENALFILIGFDPIGGRLPVAAVPGNMVLERGGVGAEGLSLGRVFSSAGILTAAQRLESSLGININATASLTRDNAVALLDILGGVRLSDLDLEMLKALGIALPEGGQRLSGAAAVNMLGGLGAGSEEQSAYLAAAVTSSVINEQLPLLTGSSGERLVKTFCNMSSTTASIDGYIKLSPAVKFVSKLNQKAAYPVKVTGHEQGAEFLLSPESQNELRTKFSPVGVNS